MEPELNAIDLKNWIISLTPKARKELGELSTSVISATEVKTANPFNVASIPLSDLSFIDDYKLDLLEALRWKSTQGSPAIWVEDERLGITVEGLRTLRCIQQFLNQNEQEEAEIIRVDTIAGTLSLNANTGEVRIGTFSAKLNPSCNEFRILLTLITSKNYQATYKQLLQREATKTSKYDLALYIKDLKKKLSILPANKRVNADFIENIKGVGYRVLLRESIP